LHNWQYFGEISTKTPRKSETLLQELKVCRS